MTTINAYDLAKTQVVLDQTYCTATRRDGYWVCVMLSHDDERHYMRHDA